MTVVVADTSPINYLVLIDEVGILRRLYHRLVIPEEVVAELLDDGAPPAVREWTAAHPEWIEVRKAPSRDASLMELDAGEGSAIALAELEIDVLLLIDDSAGRLEASRRGIPNTGTLGVLRAAAIEGLVDLPSALDRLLATNFRISKALIGDLLAEDLHRKQRGH
jgi:predicted nucleic acid-binding protein